MSKFIIFLKRVTKNYIHPAIESWKRNFELARKEMELEYLYEYWCDRNGGSDLSFSEYRNRMSFDYSDVRSDPTVTNPATGLSMIGGIGGIDIGGNAFGSNSITDYSYQRYSTYDHYNKY